VPSTMPSPTMGTGPAAEPGRPPALAIRDLAKAFGATQALRGVDITINAGEVRALLGENGSGKSTLIKILSGYHSADEGEVRVAGVLLPHEDPQASSALGLRFVHQNLGMIDTLTVAENLYLTSGYPMRMGTILERRVRSEVARDLARVGLSLNPDRRLAELSPAERTGIAVARSLRGMQPGEAAVLVLDEPTANLPDDEVQRLLDIVRSVAAEGTAVLYVTHRLEEVFQIAHTVTVLRDGEEAITAPIAQLDLAGILHQMLGEPFEAVEHSLEAHRPAVADRHMLSVRGLSASRLTNVSLAVNPGEIVGIAGITGSGREQLVGAIFGAIERTAGEVDVEGQLVKPLRPDLAIALGVACIPASRERDGGFMEHSARENLTLPRIRSFWRWPSLRLGQERAEATAWFERLHVRPPGRIEASLSSFSGGNQQKVLFAKWLQCRPRVFLLEEPTQGVDVATKAFLHTQLAEAAREGAAVLVSSSDSEELVALCHRVLVLQEGRIYTELSGPDLTTSRISYHSLGTEKRGDYA
jgi:ribose transport system ATP-binding protein